MKLTNISKRLLGITLAVATVLTSATVTGLTQPVGVKAKASKAVTVKLISSRDNRTVYMPPKGPAKIPVKAEVTGLQKGDQITGIKWWVTDSTGKDSFSVSLKKKVSTPATYRVSYTAKVFHPGSNKVSAELELVRNDKRMNIKSNTISVKTAYNAMTYANKAKEIQTLKTPVLDVKTRCDSLMAGSKQVIRVKYTDMEYDIQTKIANYTELSDATDGNIKIQGKILTPKFRALKTGRKLVYKKDWAKEFSADSVWEIFNITTSNESWKDFFTENRGYSPVIDIPVVLKYTVTFDGKTRSFTRNATVRITD